MHIHFEIEDAGVDYKTSVKQSSLKMVCYECSIWLPLVDRLPAHTLIRQFKFLPNVFACPLPFATVALRRGRSLDLTAHSAWYLCTSLRKTIFLCHLSYPKDPDSLNSELSSQKWFDIRHAEQLSWGIFKNHVDYMCAGWPAVRHIEHDAVLWNLNILQFISLYLYFENNYEFFRWDRIAYNDSPVTK